MTRTRAPQRLDEIVDAALASFSSVGYRRTRMSDVATGAGVSPGLLYSYAENKEALFALVVQRESGVDIHELSLPVESPAPRELTALLRVAFADLTMSELEDGQPSKLSSDVNAEIATIVGAHFDAVVNARRLLQLVERCASDWPELTQSHFGKNRRSLVDRLATYLGHQRDAGRLAPIGDVDITARYVIETVAWFANHRFGDHDGARLDDDAVRAEVIQLITRSLTGR